MFDRVIINRKEGDTVVKEVTKTVIEKRAPTDESLSLLHEMYSKTKESILGAFLVENDLIDFTILFMEDVICPQLKYAILIKVNGHTFIKEFLLPRQRGFHNDILKHDRELMKSIIEQVSILVAETIMRSTDLSQIGLIGKY